MTLYQSAITFTAAVLSFGSIIAGNQSNSEMFYFLSLWIVLVTILARLEWIR